MWKLFLVGAGGFLGASTRYVAVGLVHRLAREALFPYGTAAVNVLGCLAIGLLAGLAETRNVLSPEARAFLLIGVLGGMTTFSSFGYETYQLLRDGQSLSALSNVLVNVVLGLGGVWLGYSISRLM